MVSVDDISAVESRLGREAVDGNRHRPDGYDLHWKQIGVNDLITDPQLPFFIQWQVPASEHPSQGARSNVRIVGLRIAGEPDYVSRWLGQPTGHLLDDVEVQWLPVDDQDAGLVSVSLQTASGVVTLD